MAEVISQYSNKLGSLSQRLSSSIPSIRENIDISNDPAAEKSCPENYVSLVAGACVMNDRQYIVKTPWTKVDDIFFQARGQVYAMYHLMNALKYDFEKVIKDKNAEASFDQILRDLEATQQEINTIFIMNSTGFGMFTNHSLIISNYISRANAAMIDLVDLLKKG